MIITDTQTIDIMVEEASEQMETIKRAGWIANRQSFLALKAQSQKYKAVYVKLDNYFFDECIFEEEAKRLDMSNATKVFFLLTLGKFCADTFFKPPIGLEPGIECYLYELFGMLPENNLTFGFEDDEWGVNLSQQDRIPEKGIKVLMIVGYDR